ncbi:SGL-domain-containing protein [Penicillium longicatenatum]|nr:SGL-domain-containing protein [Penicillium longicatenatum]
MSDPVETLSTGSAFYVTPKGRMVLGEGVIYRASDSTLHWFDCLSSPAELYILPVDPETGSATGPARILPLSDSVTIAGFRQNKPRSYIAAYYQGVCFLDEETGKLEVACEIIPSAERSQRRFNDGGVDAAGRFWLAENDLAATAFPLENYRRTMGFPGVVCGVYLNDSVGMKITALDFDLASGSISNPRTLVDFQGTGGEPDGMVLDVEGNLWVAVYGTSHIMVFTPQGKLLKQIALPAKYPTCPTWGGKNQDILYITTAKDRTETPDPNDEGGHMYMAHVGKVQGQIKHEFRG